MIRVFNKILTGGTLFPTQKVQYKECIALSDTVPAGETKLCKVNISSLGHFLCLNITGRFTTLALSGESTIDNGVCSLRGQLSDGNGQRMLFADYIPFDLFLSPGRCRSADAINNVVAVDEVADRADSVEGLFYPFEFEYLFSANADIQLSVKNLSDADNSFDILFSGIRILQK